MEELAKDTPEITPFGIRMDEVNKPVDIFNGNFQLRQGQNVLCVLGTIFFDWFPNLGARFSGKVESDRPQFSQLDHSSKYDLIVDGLKLAECHLSRISTADEIIVEGKCLSNVVLGDKSVSVTSVSFGVINLRFFLGNSVKQTSQKDRTTLLSSRMSFEDDEYLITIDKRSDFDELNDSLSAKGGFAMLYSGVLTRKRGNMVFSSLQDVIQSFSHFLSFLNGRRCAPLFFQGTFENEVKWSDFTGYMVDAYKAVPSWPLQYSTEGLGQIWTRWRQLYQDINAKDFLHTALHWYLEANSNSGYVEGSIIMIQTALELIYNWLVIEKKHLLIGRDSENITASNKFRLLLSQLNIKTEVPQGLRNLTAFLSSNQDIVDGPDCFTQVRNAIVHSHEEKRNRLTKIPLLARYEVLQLGLWYTELSLLYVLEFDGKYFNRCTGAQWSGEGEETVPWIK